MSLKDKLTNDMKEAMKAKQTERLSTIRQLRSAIKNKEIDPDDAYVNATDKKLFQRFVTDPGLLPQVSLAVS